MQQNEIYIEELGREMSLPELEKYVRKNNKFSLEKTDIPAEIGPTTYEWGEPLPVMYRENIPKEKWDKAEPHHGAIFKRTKKDAIVGQQNRVAMEIVRDLRRNGIKPHYVRIQGGEIEVQYEASPVATWIVVCIIAAAIIAVLGMVWLTTEKVQKLVLGPFPEWMYPWVWGAVIGTGCLAVGAWSYTQFKE